MRPPTPSQAPQLAVPPRCHVRAGRRARGVSMLELLVVLGVIAILASIGFAAARPSHAMRAGRALRAAVLWARTEAMWRGTPVTVTELAGLEGFVVRAAHDAGAPCAAGTPIARVWLGDFAGVRISAGLPRGLVWLPSGSGRTCSGGGVISGTVELVAGPARVRLIVSALGRVRLEAP